MINIPEFVRESNMIESIFRDPTSRELMALDEFVCLAELTVEDVKTFVSINQPGAVIRDREGLDVQVGGHVPPPGSPHMPLALADLLERINLRDIEPWHAHVEYESLHPFTDGNGRSGRAIWAWQMRHWNRNIFNTFLQTFYYQTLQNSRRDEPFLD